MYTHDEVMKASLEYFNGNELAANVFVTKYALQDNDENFLEKTPDDMHRRLAKEFSRIEEKKFKEPLSEEEIYNYLKDFKHIIPQGSIMYGCGNTYKYVTLSNCYTLQSPYDSYLGINYLDAQIAQISSRRGGVGWDMSSLRPTGASVLNAAGSTTGVVSFMHRYSNTIREVCQSGRRGASLQSLSIKHPDIKEFITCKNNDTDITGSNISVQFLDDFMEQSQKDDGVFKLQWPVDSNNPSIIQETDPKELWDLFIDSAWKRAEPGAIFMDTVHKYSTSAPYEGFKEVTCNPCAEQIMPANSCCRLICINMYSYVDNSFLPNAKFNYTKFTHDVKIMQRLADNIVDLDIESIDRIIDKIKSDPEPDNVKQIGIDLWETIKKKSLIDRRTGCGIVGLADTLAALNLPYCSDDSIKHIDKIFKSFKMAAFESSVDMAQELGTFEVYDSEKDITSQFIKDIKRQNVKLYNRMKKYGRRNMTLLTIAPTGSVSLMTQTSSGLEPVFMLEYTRRKKINPSDTNASVDFTDKNGDKWSEFNVVHTGVEDWRKATGKIDINTSPYYSSCAHDIDYIKKIELQSVIQKHIDNSISVTTNLPSDIDKQKVSELYLLAWSLGCKGFTIYRDGCRSGVLVSKDDCIAFPEERPRKLPCDVHHISVKGQQYFVLVGLLDDRPYEVFAGKNGFLPKNTKTGTIIRKRKGFYKVTFDDADEELSPITAATDEMEEVVTRLTSGLLRTGANMLFIVQQLEKVGERQTEMYSFARSVSRTLKKYIPNGAKEGSVCPECGVDALIRIEGCQSCQSCGFSKCL